MSWENELRIQGPSMTFPHDYFRVDHCQEPENSKGHPIKFPKHSRHGWAFFGMNGTFQTPSLWFGCPQIDANVVLPRVVSPLKIKWFFSKAQFVGTATLCSNVKDTASATDYMVLHLQFTLVPCHMYTCQTTHFWIRTDDKQSHNLVDYFVSSDVQDNGYVQF